MPEQELSAYFQPAFRADVQRLYDEAGRCEDSQIPSITALIRCVITQEGALDDPFDVLRAAIGGLGGGIRSEIATALLGIDETRGESKAARWSRVAELDHTYTSGDSFRHARENKGQNKIEAILEEVADRLAALAERYGLQNDDYGQLVYVSTGWYTPIRDYEQSNPKDAAGNDIPQQLYPYRTYLDE
jgi:hypothetical protein